MTPIFAASDRFVCERIIPNHLADLLVYPPEIVSSLASGGFAVHITGEHQQRPQSSYNISNRSLLTKDMLVYELPHQVD